jgi:hypothetical protein
MTVTEPIKRLHYFDHQFLREDDFTAEQHYHMKMRRLHNHLLHTWGIAEGLVLSFVIGESRVTIGEGVAVDGAGREIVLAETRTQDLSSFAGKTVFVTIAYGEQETDPTSETGVTGNRRWTEKPDIDVDVPPPGDLSQKLILGRVTVREDGEISIDEGVEPNRRRSAGVVGGDLEARSLALTDPRVASTQWPRMSLDAANRARLTGSLHVTGDVNIDGILRAPRLNPPEQHQLVNQLGEALERGTDTTKVAKAGDTMTGPLAITAAGIGLNIMNNAEVGGSLHVAGDVNIDGTLKAHKIGYVADQFVNQLGEALEQGDVVVIGENQASLYYGPDNSVPIPEVDTTERAYDTRVCGIVSEVHGEVTSVAREQTNPGARRRRRPAVTEVRSFTPEERVQLDRTQVQPGQIGGMVTLGAYAHCKVDADIAPIQVGDLLTTSPTKGHAQKVLDPSKAIGAILGKALGTLKNGKGKIPVLVMLQ